MTFWATFAFYAMATFAMLAVAISARSHDVSGAAYVLTATWAFTNMQIMFFHPHTQFYPLMDGLMGSTFIVAWLRLRHAYLMVIASLFLAQSLAHVWYFSLGTSDYQTRYAYDLMLNVLYLGQISCVTIQGLAVKRRIFA